MAPARHWTNPDPVSNFPPSYSAGANSAIAPDAVTWSSRFQCRSSTIVPLQLVNMPAFARCSVSSLQTGMNMNHQDMMTTSMSAHHKPLSASFSPRR